VSDWQLFAAYCSCVSRLQEAEEAIREHGLLFETPNGFLQQRPEVTIANAKLNQLAKHFGLSPASRPRIEVPDTPGARGDDDDEDELQALLRRNPRATSG
jgi:P27 family predicted phage terminase small subunit